MGTRRTWWTLASMTLVGALVLGACSGSDSEGGGDSGAAVEADAPQGDADGTGGAKFRAVGRQGYTMDAGATGARVAVADEESAADQAAASGGGGSLGANTEAIPGLGPKVIKTAEVSVRIDEDGLRAAMDAVNDAIRTTAPGAYIVSTAVNDTDSGRADIVVRVPAHRFENMLDAVTDGSLGKVTSENVTGVDVSEEYVDLRARLSNLSGHRAVLRRLLEQATTIPEILRVQNELQRVQFDIERLKGRLNFLDNQTSYGTITVSLAERGAPVPREANALTRAWETAKDTALNVVSAVIVATGFVVPVALILGIAYLFIMFVLKRFRPNFQ